MNAGFRRTLALAGDGDVVYCDPPYEPLPGTAGFTNYAAGGFSWDSQVELAESCVAVKMPDTMAGFIEPVVVPLPSCPLQLAPQQYMVPSGRSAQVWLSPLSREAMPDRLTDTGTSD